jgi:hypothetical protein
MPAQASDFDPIEVEIPYGTDTCGLRIGSGTYLDL